MLEWLKFWKGDSEDSNGGGYRRECAAYDCGQDAVDEVRVERVGYHNPIPPENPEDLRPAPIYETTEWFCKDHIDEPPVFVEKSRTI
jgi:hypothetical protein